jgi:hypothetical protein
MHSRQKDRPHAMSLDEHARTGIIALCVPLALAATL